MVSQNSSSYNNVYRFSGKELDEETGLSYFGARYYNPKWSIWLSVDPLAEKFPDRSPYNYTMNNPINLIDPDGRAPEPPKNGIPQFIYNTGVYFWRADKKAYEQYKYTDSSREHYSFSGYYSVNSNSKAVGKSVSIDNNAPATIIDPANTYNGLGYAEYFDEALSGASAHAKGLKHGGGYLALSLAESGNGLYWKPNARGLNNLKGTSVNVSKGFNGGGFLVGDALEAPEIYYGYQTSTHEGNNQTAGAVGSVGGGWLGGAGAGAVLGLAGIGTGPFVIITVAAGAAIGGYYGEEKVEQIYDSIFKE